LRSGEAHLPFGDHRGGAVEDHRRAVERWDSDRPWVRAEEPAPAARQHHAADPRTGDTDRNEGDETLARRSLGVLTQTADVGGMANGRGSQAMLPGLSHRPVEGKGGREVTETAARVDQRRNARLTKKRGAGRRDQEALIRLRNILRDTQNAVRVVAGQAGLDQMMGHFYGDFSICPHRLEDPVRKLLQKPRRTTARLSHSSHSSPLRPDLLSASPSVGSARTFSLRSSTKDW
jgi:hypothetical protein